MRRIRLLSAFALVAAAACAAPQPGPSVGGESHFLRECADGCPEGLECMSGVCTLRCGEDAACASMSELARCPDPSGIEATRTCEVTCSRDADCEAMGEGFECAAGVCRDAQISVSQAPLVMIIADTSGSLERLPSCECEDLGCLDCLPDCEHGERNRFALLIEALSGTWEDFHCEAFSRQAADATGEIEWSYDLDYYLPYHRPPVGQEQLGDGVLDTYRTRVRFGMATLDGQETYLGASRLVPLTTFDDALSAGMDGLYSYGSTTPDGVRMRADGHVVGGLRYPNTTTDYRIDSGLRGPQADEGGVVHAANDDEMLEVNERIQQTLRRVRPFGGTPVASAFDDLLYYFTADPAVRERTTDTAADRHVILFTDFFSPDGDYRDLGCDCATSGDPDDPLRCGPSPNDPATMYCPYPTPEQALNALVDRAVATVHVVTTESADSGASSQAAAEAADDLAAAGGTDHARVARTSAEVRETIEAIIEEILAARKLARR